MANRYDTFRFDNTGYMILHEHREYSCTDSGKSWKSKPYEVTRDVITPEHYTNYVTSIPFFNRFGYGAYCRGHWGYECAGYLPVEIVTVSPGREQKNIDTFRFINYYRMEEKAGYREKDIMQRAKTWESEYISGRGTLYTFITEEDESGHCDSATIQERGYQWVN